VFVVVSFVLFVAIIPFVFRDFFYYFLREDGWSKYVVSRYAVPKVEDLAEKKNTILEWLLKTQSASG
jgi:hypothetical protein